MAVVKLEDNLKVGDQIKVVKDEKEFTQTVNSMQAEHKDIKEGKKGDELGLKVDQAVKEGAAVYLIG